MVRLLVHRKHQEGVNMYKSRTQATSLMSRELMNSSSMLTSNILHIYLIFYIRLVKTSKCLLVLSNYPNDAGWDSKPYLPVLSSHLLSNPAPQQFLQWPNRIPSLNCTHWKHALKAVYEQVMYLSSTSFTYEASITHYEIPTP